MAAAGLGERHVRRLHRHLRRARGSDVLTGRIAGRSLYCRAMVLFLLVACDADKGPGSSDDSGCPSGETWVDGDCVPATDDSGPPGDDTGTPEVHARWVSAGTSHTCFLLDGVVTCWGKN